MGDKIAKVSLNGQTLIDVSEDSVTPEVLARNETAHDAAGESIRGTAEFGGDTSDCYKTTDPASTDIADNDYIPFNDVSDSETPKKKTLFSNIKEKLKAMFSWFQSANSDNTMVWNAKVGNFIAQIKVDKNVNKMSFNWSSDDGETWHGNVVLQNDLGIGTNDYTFLRKDGTWKMPLLDDAKVISSGDLNDMTTPGFYMSSWGNYSNITNHPPFEDAYWYWVINSNNSDGGYFRQIAFSREDATKIFTRTYKASRQSPWTDWVKIANTDDDKFIVNYGTDIPSNADLNDYKNPGTYNVKFNATAATIANIPTNKAGKLIVMNNASNQYRTQLYIPFNNTGGQLYQRSWNNDNSADTWTIWEDYSKGNCYVGQCDTAADQQVKVVTVDADFVFRKGIILAVNFANTNTATNVKLKIANVECPIRYASSVYTGNTAFITGAASQIIYYMFNGTEWAWLSIGRNHLELINPITSSQIVDGTDTGSRPVRADYLKSGILNIMNATDAWLCRMRLRYIDIPDNSGYPKYLLLHDVTEWYNSTTTGQKTQGFSGWIIASRQNGIMGNSIAEVKALVSYQKVTSPSSNGGAGTGSLILESTHRYYRSCILKDGDNKYYLAIRCDGSGRQATLFGVWVHDNNRNNDWTGYIGTFVNCTDANGTLPSGYSVAIQGRADSSPLKTLHYTNGRVYGTRQDDLDNYMPVPYQIVSSSFVEDTSGAMILHIQPDGSGDNAFELKYNIGNDKLCVNRVKNGNWLGDSQIYWKYRPNIVFCTCSTAAGTAAKVATSTFGKIVELCAGMIAAVRFSGENNTASNCTLNVDGTGAKSLYYYASVYTGNSGNICGAKNRTIYYMYDGTNWCWLTCGWENDTVRPGSYYGTCSSAAGDQIKVVTVSDTSFSMVVGTIIGVKFTNSNSYNATADNKIQINVNSKGAKPIYYNTGYPTGTSATVFGTANRVHYYMYDGTNWVWLNFNNELDTYTSAYCGTGGGTAAKAASMSGYTLLSKSHVLVNMLNANTVQGAITLNINGRGAKPIYINGSASSASNYTLPAGSYLVYYNGTNYYFRTDGKITCAGTVTV